MTSAKPTTVNEYIASFPESTQKILQQIRATIQKLIPGAEETISYGIPTFKVDGKYVIYFAGYTNHISIYPAPREHKDFKKELAAYKGGKGTVQFPLRLPIPFELIKRITKFQLKQAALRK